MKKIKIAQIGTSKYSHGTAIFGSICKQTDLFEMVGYAFPENEEEKFPDMIAAFAPYRKMTVEEGRGDVIRSSPGLVVFVVKLFLGLGVCPTTDVFRQLDTGGLA